MSALSPLDSKDSTKALTPWLQILHGHSAKSFCLKNDADNILTTFLFVDLFICLPPSTVNLSDLCTLLELGSLTQLEEARDPYAHLSGVPTCIAPFLFETF